MSYATQMICTGAEREGVRVHTYTCSSQERDAMMRIHPPPTGSLLTKKDETGHQTATEPWPPNCLPVLSFRDTCPWESVFYHALYIAHQVHLSLGFIYLFLHGLLCFC